MKTRFAISLCAGLLVLMLCLLRAPQPVETRGGRGDPVDAESSPPTPGGLVPAIALDRPAFEPRDEPLPSRQRVHSHPHGKKVCASGCVLSNHATPVLSKQRCRALLQAYQAVTYDREGSALNALIYFGSQTRAFLDSGQFDDLLDQRHRTFLRRELSKTHVVVSFRIVDRRGVLRVNLPATAVPQHIRQVYEMDVTDLQPLSCSGTVKRVGLNHVWQRL